MIYLAEIDAGQGGLVRIVASNDAEAVDRARAWAQGASYDSDHALIALRIRREDEDESDWRSEYLHVHYAAEMEGGIWDRCPACRCRGCPGADDSSRVASDDGELATCECGEYAHTVRAGCDGGDAYDPTTGRWVSPIHVPFDAGAFHSEWEVSEAP